MNKERRELIIQAVDDVMGLQGLAEEVADHIIVEGLRNVTLESLTSITLRPEGSDREKSVTEAGAKRVLAAINFSEAFRNDELVKEKRNRINQVDRFLATTTDYNRP